MQQGGQRRGSGVVDWGVHALGPRGFGAGEPRDRAAQEVELRGAAVFEVEQEAWFDGRPQAIDLLDHAVDFVRAGGDAQGVGEGDDLAGGALDQGAA